MKYIKRMVDYIDDELCDAKKYAELYIEYKVNGSQWAVRFKEMAKDELEHANTIHALAVEEIEKLSKVFTAPTDMMEEWKRGHAKYVDKSEWITKMLEM